MTILYPAPAPVKSARRFGAGILPSTPRPFEPSAEDRAWWAAECERLEAARENAHLDWMAVESAATDWHEAGLCC